DPSGRFCMVGFGILLELLSIAASPHGLKVVASYDCGDTRLDPGKVGPQPLARLRLVKRTGTEVEPLDRQLILDRRTSRLPYDDRPVDASVLAELATVAASFGHKL